MAQPQPARRKMRSTETEVSIPDKLYFRIGDVARLCDLPAYVLRFWETEFPQLKPNKAGTGQRLYRKRDVELVLAIKHLLYRQGFTIAGARQQLADKRRIASAQNPDRAAAQPSRQTLEKAGRHIEPTPISPVAPSKTPPATQPIPSKPRLKDLRKEMQELLKMLGSTEPGKADAVPGPLQTSKKATQKKMGKAGDEPTLF